MLFDRIFDCCNIITAILDGAYGWINEAIAIVILVFVINFIAKRGLIKIQEYFSKTHQVWKGSFVQALYKPLSVYVWFFAFFHTLDLISHRVFEGTIFSNMHLVLNVGLVLSSAWFFMRWKKFIVLNTRSIHSRLGNLEANKVDVMDKIVTMIILFLTALFVLEITGQNINTLIAFGGIGGLAIAFASQEMIANFFGGLMIYATHPFSIGDWINLPEHHVEGYVEEIGWYMTRIRSMEKRPIYIPNSMFSKVVVMTPSRMSHRKFDETIGIRYKDMPVAKAIIEEIKEMLKSHPNVDDSQHNLAHLVKFGTYSVDIRVAAYISDISSVGYVETKQDLLFKIYDIVTKHGAEMPFPTTQQA